MFYLGRMRLPALIERDCKVYHTLYVVFLRFICYKCVSYRIYSYNPFYWHACLACLEYHRAYLRYITGSQNYDMHIRIIQPSRAQLDSIEFENTSLSLQAAIKIT